MTARRPLIDRVEIGAPRLAALAAKTLGYLPAPIRRRALQGAFGRAQEAFNRGDLDAVFALFAPDVEYSPPPPLYQGEPMRGRPTVLAFWRGVLARYDDSQIENLSLQEASGGRIVRRARLRHRSSTTGETLSYAIVQTTELCGGRVVRQINVLDRENQY